MYCTCAFAALVACRPALGKNIYGKLFDWLVKQLNATMMSKTLRTTIIGVLDIFGFEIFKTNSFEQLCINYCNEKLQQHFNTHVFKEEQKCYEAEGIDFGDVSGTPSVIVGWGGGWGGYGEGVSLGREAVVACSAL